MRQPRFLFILTLPYSGSTALATVLNSSPRSMLLNLRAEGQWMVPALSKQDRWDPDNYIDWDSARDIWLKRYYLMDAHEGPFDVIIEKSPPHMVRIEQLMAVFPGAACFAFNRDPYAYCASILFRLHSPETLDEAGRRAVLIKIAEGWLERSDCLCKAIIRLNLLYFSYETFCVQPEECIARVLEICPELVTVDCSQQITVKDYPVQGISNQNPRQIGLLARVDKDTVSAVLSQRMDLVEYYGYSLF